jgi:CubicO group peptidase (beta-lactamase class C family)
VLVCEARRVDAPTATRLPADVVTRVEGLVERFAAGGPGRGQPGVAWGVVADGALALSGGVGTLRAGEDRRPDSDSVFRIASMTKSFTAAAVLALRDAGSLGLDDPVGAHVPDLADLALPTADSPALTLRHLLTMSGGLPTDDAWGDRQQGLADDAFGAFLRDGLSFAWVPGTTFEYSNLGYAILGRVVAAVAGADYAAAVRRLVLDPLGLTSTVYRAHEVDPARLAVGHRPATAGPSGDTSGGTSGGESGDVSGGATGANGATARRDGGGWEALPFDPYGAFAPMGGLFSSVADLARWVAGFADAFPPRDAPDGGHPLRRASRREMQQQHRSIPARVLAPAVDEPAIGRGGGYGYGLVAEHDPRLGAFVGHSGGYPGFGSHMRWHPDSRLGVVVLANSTYAPAQSVAAQMLLALLDTRRSRVLAAMEAVERLVAVWDDAAAERLLADNVHLDEPLAARRERAAAAVALAGRGGALARDPRTPPVHDSPAHALWWLRGRRGRVRLEIRLTPHLEPLVQTLSVTPVPDPSPGLAEVVRAVAAELGSPTPGWPAGVALAPGCDATSAVRQLRVAAAYAGGCAVGEASGGDGFRTTVVRLAGVRAPLDLSVEVDAAGAVRRLVVGHPEQGHPSTD